ncbi:acyl-CoA dehydrogenase family protein [Mycobacterium sherrisii]|uniref:acyl-CoA dehydrogenase family protein n=1 Tax=Mycobacterium sherrisii TaxID=243061 RepID=UPI00397511BA
MGTTTMDFTLDDDLVEAKKLAASIFADMADADRVKHIENHDAGHDAKLWSTLADAGMLGIALPEPLGGSGLGMFGLICLLEEQGRKVAPIPLWSVIAGAAMPIAQFGTAAQQQRWLPGIINGTALVTGAAHHGPLRAAADGAGRWLLRGDLAIVAAAPVADAVLTPVTLPEGSHRLVIVPTDRRGVTCTPAQCTDRLNAGTLSFDAVPIDNTDLLGEAELTTERDAIAFTVSRCQIALAGLQAGVCTQALHTTAAYTSQRIQFGRPLSTNQAVAVRAADAYLDTEAIKLTAQRAAWLIDTVSDDTPAVRTAALVAKWWASRAGLRVVHATQHLHGGIGADIDYPIHRYFLWGRQIAFSLGTAAAVAADLGAMLPTAPPIGAAK